MRMTDIIEKKKRGLAHTREEIDFLIAGLLDGSIPDYQVTAWLMAVCFRGMTDEETAVLTDAMAHSGDTVDLSALGDGTVDKHSTGGVGDKTTLVIAPLVASLGGTVAKMSGRGLGFTGGTVDKLESIPGFCTELARERFFSQTRNIGVAVVGQSGNLTPADKKLYALRDVTATVDSIPLIASSIMSKKLAAGARSIVLDVKVGSGAFMKDVESARLLAEKMAAIGRASGRRVSALLTNMDVPLGHAIGNALEVAEAISVLDGNGPRDLTELCLALASEMLSLSLGISRETARARCLRALADGSAKHTLVKLVSAQGGDASYIVNPSKFPRATAVHTVTCPCDGYLARMYTDRIGITAAMLGAGRQKKTDVIDMTAGIVLLKKTGDRVVRGEALAMLHSSAVAPDTAENTFLSALDFSHEAPAPQTLIYDILSDAADG